MSQMIDAVPETSLPRAGSYAWRLALLIPAFAMAAVGIWTWKHPPDGGSVSAIRLTTKGDLAGQAREAYDSIDPGTPDIYLVIARRGDGHGGEGHDIKLPPYDNTPVGNGLTFTLPRATDLLSIKQIAIWDQNTVVPDKQLDRIELPETGTWSADGQTFHIDLYGIHTQPPDWALPLAAVGGTLFVVVLLRFVWDQAI